MKNFQTIKPKIEGLIAKPLAQYHLQIYEINNFIDFEDDILQVLVEDKDEPNKPLDFDTLVLVNEEISKLLDEVSEIKERYLLEVASAGIEKTIRNGEELQRALSSYIYLEFKKPIEKLLSVEGYLKEYNAKTQQFKLEYFIKGQPKRIIFDWEMIKTARYAVKF